MKKKALQSLISLLTAGMLVVCCAAVNGQIAIEVEAAQPEESIIKASVVGDGESEIQETEDLDDDDDDDEDEDDEEEEDFIFTVKNGVLLSVKDVHDDQEGEIEIPDTVKTISKKAFSKLSSSGTYVIDIPASVNKIEAGAFKKIPYVNSFNVSKRNKKYASYKKALYDKKKTTLIRYPYIYTSFKGVTVKASQFPKSLRVIESNAINVGLPKKYTKIMLPSGVKELKKSAIFGDDLTIYLPADLKKIEKKSVIDSMGTRFIVKKDSNTEMLLKSKNIHYSYN